LEDVLEEVDEVFLVDKLPNYWSKKFEKKGLAVVREYHDH
jgi:hypothetical protein